jgi:hypothetical protein
MLKKTLSSGLLLLAIISTGICQQTKSKSRGPVALLFDTDFGPDYEDAGA